jgi:mannose-6-phosphate isomerase-like protein (cupin superfamily)
MIGMDGAACSKGGAVGAVDQELTPNWPGQTFLVVGCVFEYNAGKRLAWSGITYELGAKDVTTAKSIEKISIAEQISRLTEPFTMVDLVEMDDLVLSVFLCHGNMPFHRHMDQDELFLVHSGEIILETDWGKVTLRPGEIAVAPKGLGHRSSSLLRSLVFLLQPRLMANRRNGDRRLFALKDSGRLEKVSAPAMARQLSGTFEPLHLIDVDTFAFYLMAIQGAGPWWSVEEQSTLIWCHEGRVTLETEFGMLSLDSNELTLVPRGVPHRLSSAGQAVIFGVRRHQPPGPPLAG